MEYTPAQRIDKIAKDFEMSIAEVAYACGYKRAQAFYDVMNEKTKNISGSMATRIATAFPTIRESWLLTGDGEMLKYQPNEPHNPPPDHNVVEESNNKEAMELMRRMLGVIESQSVQLGQVIATNEKAMEEIVRSGQRQDEVIAMLKGEASPKKRAV